MLAASKFLNALTKCIHSDTLVSSEAEERSALKVNYRKYGASVGIPARIRRRISKAYVVSSAAMYPR